MAAKKRIERDSLGKKELPAGVYYGIQTLRAKENFPVSKIPPKPHFIKATAFIKKAAAEVNSELFLLDKKIAHAIISAADEVITGCLDKEFIVDVYQAGAGTSHNMNANEVLANRAIEILSGKKGDYKIVHPNDHVNMAQSTNDVIPTAMRLSALDSSVTLLKELKNLTDAFQDKAREFNNVIKSGRTHLQDAVPITLGQEFSSYAESIRKCAKRIIRARDALKRLGIGASAIGTGINTHPKYRSRMIKTLQKISHIKGLKSAENLIEATNSIADFVELSSTLKVLSIELIKIANDLRLLSSGPRTGFSEIKLPAVQPGSSIMPGKVNPVIAEMLNMVCFQVIGNDLAVTMAAQAGQLELNVMMPVVNYNILQSIELLTNGVSIFTAKCVKGIKADEKKCREYFENSVALVTVLNPFIGYEKAAEVAKEAIKNRLSIREVIIKKGIITEKKLNEILAPSRITKPNQVSPTPNLKSKKP